MTLYKLAHPLSHSGFYSRDQISFQAQPRNMVRKTHYSSPLLSSETKDASGTPFLTPKPGYECTYIDQCSFYTKFFIIP